MDLQSLFFVTQTIQAIFVSLFIIYIVYLLIGLTKSIKEIEKNVNKVAEESFNAAVKAEEYAEKVGRTLVDFIVIKLIDSFKKGRR